DSAAYRILQESITNVIRHVGPTRVTVSLDYRPDLLEVRVADEGGRVASDGAAPAQRGVGSVTTVATVDADPAHPGRGIIGMRERCGLLGGDLVAGPRPSGGFEVRARLPLAPAATVRS